MGKGSIQIKLNTTICNYKYSGSSSCSKNCHEAKQGKIENHKKLRYEKKRKTLNNSPSINKEIINGLELK